MHMTLMTTLRSYITRPYVLYNRYTELNYCADFMYANRTKKKKQNFYHAQIDDKLVGKVSDAIAVNVMWKIQPVCG